MPTDEAGKEIQFGNYLVRSGQTSSLQYSKVIGWNKGTHSHLLRVASVRWGQGRGFYTSEGVLKMPGSCLVVSHEILPPFALVVLGKLEVDKE